MDVAQTEATTGQGGQTCDGSGTCSTPDGYVFTAGEPNALTYNIRKYTLAGAASTIIARNSIIYGLSIDSAGNIYSGGVGTATGGNGGLRKYTGSSLQWDKDHGGTIYAVAANASDVCIGGAPATLTDSKTTRKYTSSGTLSWSADHGNYVQAVAIDASGNVYSGGVVSSSVTTRKYNSGGTEQWNANHGATVRGIVVDSAGNVFTCGNNTGSYSIRKYNSSGSLVWSANSGDNDYGIALDASGNVYVCGIGYIRKFDSSGAEVTSGGFPITGLGAYAQSQSRPMVEFLFAAKAITAQRCGYIARLACFNGRLTMGIHVIPLVSMSLRQRCPSLAYRYLSRWESPRLFRIPTSRAYRYD